LRHQWRPLRSACLLLPLLPLLPLLLLLTARLLRRLLLRCAAPAARSQ
jgi:hypothetical protein